MSASTFTRPSWTAEIEAGTKAIRDAFKVAPPPPLGTAKTPAQRATLPNPATIPDGVVIKSIIVVPHGVEFADDGSGKAAVRLPESIALPSQLQDARISPEAVPVFTYERNGRAAAVQVETNVIFWLHAGGNVSGHPADYNMPCPQWVPTISKVAVGFDGVIFAPSYRLATTLENTYPANLQDIWHAYQYVLEQGYQPKNIRFVGESAGGNSVLILTYLLHLLSKTLPHSIAAFCPAADHDYVLSPYAAAQADADIFPIGLHRGGSDLWLLEPGAFPPESLPSRFQGVPPRDRKDPLISAMYIPVKDIAGWPKTLLVTGTADQLVDPSRYIHEEAGGESGKVQLLEVEGGVHGFWHFPFYGKVRDDAWAAAVKFIQ
ncbi:alpha beta-hydrolase [Coniophora puteana RWD-64-598 SS2]|uniref:Alpha beta-hydrolase n=1 Tax=Coniophora puteana (strain RWD-64-598) TaxID=741705 RepID=R7SDG4_CONPW|nr:alpha beta-hydrolase [Coniophora puteana RWD-64-598 SS2]EIW74193.1 alpha beta-hydrolase [Coniophora puteana RWD-64-598 SS2]